MLNEVPGTDYDLAIIGGGINGVGIAADAAGRGLQVVLLEAGDLGAATSSWSSKLIHGGLRYLEQYAFRMVREALRERERLLHAAPHLVRPLRIQMPHHQGVRPVWLLRAGLFLYDHLYIGMSLPRSRGVRFTGDSPLQPQFVRGFEYSDCRVDDARLVIANALQAREHGALVLPRHRMVSAAPEGRYWRMVAQPQAGNSPVTIRARALVNAGGPWASQIAGDIVGVRSRYRMRHIKGSHIVVPRIHGGEHGFLLQHPSDGRVVFVLPFLEQYSLVGTTDIDHQGDPEDASIDADETQYLLQILAHYFRETVVESDIVWRFCGVRPIVAQDRGASATAPPSKASRDYVLELLRAGETDGPPLLNVFGGKLTGYRALAEEALDQLAADFPQMGAAWTARALLPGAEGVVDAPSYAEMLRGRYAWLSIDEAQRIAAAYGSRAERWLPTQRPQRRFGPLFAPEVDYLCREEWAQSADDLLWRRSKAALAIEAVELPALEDELNRYIARTQLE